MAGRSITKGDDLAFLAGDGEMSRRIRTHDWSPSPLGHPGGWPESLRAVVSLMLNSKFGMCLAWGPELSLLYNDQYAQFMHGKHPAGLGQRFEDAWSDIWSEIAPLVSQAMSGEAVYFQNLPLIMNRKGYAEETWWTFSYSPVRDESGEIAGMLNVTHETTEEILGARRLARAEATQRQALQQMPGFAAVTSGPDHIYEYVNDAYVAISGRTDFVGRSFKQVFPDIAGQGFFEMLDRAYQSGVAVAARGMELRLQGSDQTQFIDFVVDPIRDEDGTVKGVFIGGYEVTGARRAQTRRDALIRLTDLLADVDDPADAEFAAASVLGETLGLARAGYGAIDPDADVLTVERDWTGPGTETIAGVLHLRHFGSFVDDLKRGETVTIGDIDADSRTAPAAEAVKGRGVRSLVNVPVMERGRLVAMLFVNDGKPRVWAADDLALIREVAARTRTASARIRSDVALRESEARLRFLDALARETATLKDADAILTTTTRMTGEYLGVSICAYADMDDDQDGFTIRGDWAAPGSSSIVGHYSLAAFGELAVRNLGAGEPLVVKDNLAELAPAEAATFQAIGIAATICMPLVKEGRLTALMAIHDRAPRAWTDNELAVIREVTARSWAHVERVGAEAELRGSEANFRTLARTLPNHVWTSRPDGELDWFNEQVYSYSGAPAGSLDGRLWTQMVHPEDVPVAQARWAAALQSGETYETEFRLRRADGAWRWHLARAVAIKGPTGEPIRWIGANTDIHDQKEMNTTLEERVEERTAQLLRTEEALRQAQKMEAVGQLTGGIAHDFNNLLTGISGSLEMLERRMSQGKLAGVERYIDAAQGAARRAAALTQRLLAFSRRQTLDPKAIDVNRLIAGMEDLVRRTVGPDIAVEVVGAGGLWTTRVDPSQLENALLNLCINARDAMAPRGGRLTIETANKWLDDRAAKERELPPGQYVSLRVTDTGTGMTAEVKERAFDPFFTTKPLGLGTGLGLSMIYGFVRQSGGQVRIYSELGKGTTMCLYLPRYSGDADAEVVVDMEQTAPGHGETVLVIDDEDMVRMLIVDVLEEHGYAALEAIDGPSGMKILQSEARIDLLITDVGLPGGMNGRQVADAARTVRPGLKVLFVTGYAENAVVGNGHLDPGMEVITKPFGTAALGHKIRELIDRS